MIKILKNLSPYKSVLCLNGDLRCDIIKQIGLPVVAADGAANTLIKNGIEPTIIVGDLDSVDADLLRNRSHLKVADQDNTDFEKALDFIEKDALAPAIIMGIDGGYIDHILGNISIFSGTDCVAICGDIVLMPLEDDKIFNLPMDTKISIFGMPSCTISSEGLKWKLDNHELSISGMNSCCNRVVSPCVELKITSGKALVFIYTKAIIDAGSSDFGWA